MLAEEIQKVVWMGLTSPKTLNYVEWGLFSVGVFPKRHEWVIAQKVAWMGLVLCRCFPKSVLDGAFFPLASVWRNTVPERGNLVLVGVRFEKHRAITRKSQS